MKTAISIDKDVYQAAESAACRMGLSRSALYTLAIKEYVSNHNPDELLKQLNAVYSDPENRKVDEDLAETQYRLFASEDW
jgi:metal-responsive CopG/Arc/MetJ family transcriptional regulator